VKYLSSKQRVRVGGYTVDIRQSLREHPAPVILFIHGIGVSGTYFLPLAHEFSQTYDVRIIDMPGYGNTPRPDHVLEPKEMADIAAAYLRQSGVNSAVVAGQSMGCQTAARLAVRHPSLCAKLVLIGPPVNKRERSVVAQGLRLFQDMLMEPPQANRVVLSDYARMGAIRYFKTIRRMISDHLEEYLPTVGVPVLIARGAKDNIAPHQWAQQLAGITPGAKLCEIAGAAHVVQFTKPRELFAACEEFLST
jgi:pimeloyl-ACP methyl ester carboxylesterase